MPSCLVCARQVRSSALFCPHCGAKLHTDNTLTIASAPDPPLNGDPTVPGLDSSAAEYGPLDDARFAPGQIFASRYRIVSLLGRGGMGEVYRAEDLRLGQAVALKLLTAPLSREPARLHRFLAEVRLPAQLRTRMCVECSM